MLDFLKNGTRAVYIDHQGRDNVIDVLLVDYYIAWGKHTVKVEGLENYFTEYLPGTVHCFISPRGAASFAEHTDPVDLEIKCLEGTKTMIVEGKEIDVHEGHSIYIPAGTPHKATNKYSSVMLSIGHEQ
jgi:mannose-6-phosphate isomerase-like protein (cupin superfamily)